MIRIVCTAALLAGLLSMPAMAQSQTVFLLRHAEKSSEPSADPELTDAGNARALRLVSLFAQAKPSAVYSTQYRRTMATAAPLAKAMDLPVTVLPVSKENADQYPELLKQAVCALPSGSNAVVIGHSNTLPAIVQAWTGTPVNAIDDKEYDRLFMVKLEKCQAAGSMDLRY